LVAVQLDVSKAFDTVPHEAIGDALRRKGVPNYVVRMIKRSYEGVTTDIKHGTVAVPLELKRGVKQGDPLSLLLFNAILEPLLLRLKKQQGYKINDECSVSSLGFADDIILVARDVP
jgi:hypothetical protein